MLKMKNSLHHRLPLSVAVISFNEEDDIGRTLESIADIASEIIVVDSHSTDRTREVAENSGAKVYEEDWKGHIDQKNSALRKCTQEWILFLDCDEVVSNHLKQSIVNAVTHPAADGYFVNRKTSYLGKMLEHAWQPDRKLRLVKSSSSPQWGGYNPHDVLSIKGKTARIKGDLIHYSYQDIQDHFGKAVAYSRIVAHAYAERGRRFHILNLIANPIVAFMMEFIGKRGFLDGVRGFAVAVSVTFYTFLKYLYLWENELKKSKARP